MFHRLRFGLRFIFNNSRNVNTDVKFIQIPRPNKNQSNNSLNIPNIQNFSINKHKPELLSVCDNYHNNIPRRKILLGNIEYKTEFYVRKIASLLNIEIDKITDIRGLRCIKDNIHKDYINVSSQSDFDTIIDEYKIIGQENTIINWKEYIALILSHNDLSLQTIPINIIDIAKKNKIILLFL
jgi:hypothetical protein